MKSNSQVAFNEAKVSKSCEEQLYESSVWIRSDQIVMGFVEPLQKNFQWNMPLS